MSDERIEKYDFFKDLLVEIFQIEEKYLNRKILSDNIKLKINLKEISKFLIGRLTQLLENSQDFNEIQNNYIEHYFPWKKKFEAFQNAINNSKMSEFFHDHYSTWERLKFESNQNVIEEISQILEILKPNIKRFYNTSFWGYRSFKIFKSNRFQIILLIRLERNKTETFSLEIIFSFWFEYEDPYRPLDLRFITSNYGNQMIAYNIMKKLKSLGYTEDSLIYKEEQKSRFQTTVKKEIKPHPSTCAILKILNDNPSALFDELLNHLHDVDDIITGIINEDEYSPHKYYDSLPKEVKKFLLTGKELLSKLDDIFAVKPLSIKKSKEEIKSIEADDKLDELLGIFKKALEEDKKDNSIETKDKGFRTLHMITNEYDTALTYSHPVYYKYFEDNDLSVYFEVRKKSGIGGGTQYRYKEFYPAPTPIKILEKEPKEQIPVLVENLKIQEAFYEYDNKNYQNSISLFENILKKPSIPLKNEQELFLACLYYLGRSYFKLHKYKKAYQGFERTTMFNKNLINVNFYFVECNRFLGNYQKATITLTEVISTIQDLLEKYFPILDLRLIFKRRFNDSDLTNIHPDILRNVIFSDLLVFYNKDTSNIHIDVLGEQFEEQEIYLAKNIVAVRSLFKIYEKSLFLKMELLRRQVFQSIIENEEDTLKTNVNQLIEHIKSFKLIPNFKKNYNIQPDGYLLYLSNVSKTFDKPFIKQIIEEEFEVPKSFYFLERSIRAYYPITSFIDNYNEFSKWLDEWPERIFHFEGPITSYLGRFYQLEPILKAEYLFTQVYINNKYIINSIIEEQNSKKLIDIQDLHEYYGYPISNPKSLVDISKKAYDFCKEHNFKTLEKKSYDLLKIAKEKCKHIKELLLKRRILSLNQYFKDLHNYYEIKESKIIELNFEQQPDEKNIGLFVHAKIIDKIGPILRDELNNLIIRLKLFSAEILDDLIEEIKKDHQFLRQNLFGIEYFFDIDLNFNKLPHEKTLIIEVKCVINLDNEHYFFFENLDRITKGIFKILEYGINEFRVKIKLNEMEKYEEYFKNQFQTDFENKFFKFDIQKASQKGIYHIKILKL